MNATLIALPCARLVKEKERKKKERKKERKKEKRKKKILIFDSFRFATLK